MQQGTGDPSRTRPVAVNFETLAEVLSEAPVLMERLLVQHVPTAGGACRYCRAVKPVRWPCGPRRLAERALEIRRGRQ